MQSRAALLVCTLYNVVTILQYLKTLFERILVSKKKKKIETANQCLTPFSSFLFLVTLMCAKNSHFARTEPKIGSIRRFEKKEKFCDKLTTTKFGHKNGIEKCKNY